MKVLAHIRRWVGIAVAFLVFVGGFNARANDRVALPAAAEDFATLWTRAKARFPQLARYRLLTQKPPALERLLGWAGAKRSTVVYDESCRPIRVHRENSSLVGEKIVRVTVRGRTRQVTAYNVTFGEDRSVDGPGTMDYRLDRNGRWIQNGAAGCGCVETPPNTLTLVKNDSAWYSEARVTLSISCNAWKTVTRPCTDGSDERSCHTCTGIGIEVSGWNSFNSDSNLGSRTEASIRESEKDNCSVPCPPDENTDLVERLNKLLDEHSFLPPDKRLGRPTLFRTEEACHSYRSRH